METRLKLHKKHLKNSEQIIESKGLPKAPEHKSLRNASPEAFWRHFFGGEKHVKVMSNAGHPKNQTSMTTMQIFATRIHSPA